MNDSGDATDQLKFSRFVEEEEPSCLFGLGYVTPLRMAFMNTIVQEESLLT